MMFFSVLLPFLLSVESKSTVSRTYTVSGLSSGAFFAVQHAVAWSSEVTGLGVVAGGPYYCAKGSEITAIDACMDIPSEINLNTLYSDTSKFVSQGHIDDTSNIKDMLVYFYSGTKDTVVATGSVQKGVEYFENYVSDKSQVFFKDDIASEHAMITNDYGNACNKLGEPYINNCNFDLVGDIFKFIYGNSTLKPAIPLNDVPYPQNLVALDQNDYTPNNQKADQISMEDTAYVYVATNCSIMPLSSHCNLHVAYHGCSQDLTTLWDGKKYNDTYVEYSGYNKWAEPNDMVILYPQASTGVDNPEGCWDWWGYLLGDSAYAWQTGAQMATVHNMVNAIIGS